MKNLIYKLMLLPARKARAYRRKIMLSNSIASGMKVGAGTKFVGSQTFGSEPYLIDIGSNCLITDGVSFICHDGAWCVACGLDGMTLDESYTRYTPFGTISIGNNCFIGVNAVLLPNTSIGRDSIVGAGAIVKGSFPNGSVIAGNPCKVVGKTEDYKRRNNTRVTEIPKFKTHSERKQIILANLPETGDIW